MKENKSDSEPEWCLIRVGTRGTKILCIPLKGDADEFEIDSNVTFSHVSKNSRNSELVCESICEVNDESINSSCGLIWII